MSDNPKLVQKQQLARERRIRKHLAKHSDRFRLVVFRSAAHIYAQIIDDSKHHTLVSSSTLATEFGKIEKKIGGIEAAKWVGKDIAEKAVAKGIKEVAFDKGRFLYHGRVKALAEAARENGLAF